ncbi:MAG TPA: thioredoxin domain-containing protein, partial [Acidimicrobiia bacterium]
HPLEMVRTTLDAMAAGGIYDHVGGGFARYSTDAFWLVPHFEKMLYDQALLTGAYLRGFLVTGEHRYLRVVEETIGYVLRDMRDADGGFFSAEDADSEGVEGKFYLWSPQEIRDACGPDADAVIEYFGVTDEGNFTDPHTGYSGTILSAQDRTAERPAEVTRALPKLLERRSARVRPALDDKVLLSWNAWFTRSLAEAAAATARDDWMQAALTNTRFLLRELRRPDGRLMRSWQTAVGARHLAYAEDYAALLELLLTLVAVDSVEWLSTAREIADQLLALFHDEESGGFFTTGTDAESLIVRPQAFFDNATPSENSLAADALLRLAAITGNEEDADPARSLLGLLGPALGEHASAFSFMLGAYERAATPAIEIALVGSSDALRREVFGRLIPNSVAVQATRSDTDAALTPLLADRQMIDGSPTAYVCERFACRMPVTDSDALRAEIDAALLARPV